MKHIIIIALLLLAGGCVSEPRTEISTAPKEDQPGMETGTGTTSDAGMPDAGEKTEAPTETPGSTQEATFSVADFGVLVKAPDGTRITPRQWDQYENPPPGVIANPLAMAVFNPSGRKPTGGNDYIVTVLPKEEGETLQEWSKHSYYGDAFFPDETVTTKNGKVGIVYSTNDLGALPAIHVMIPTDRFVYRIDWDDSRIPEDAEAAMVFLRNRRAEYMRVPTHFLEFVRSLEVE